MSVSLQNKKTFYLELGKWYVGQLYPKGLLGPRAGFPQNMPQWHIDYFELKLLKKQLMQEGHFEAPPPTPRLPEGRE